MKIRPLQDRVIVKRVAEEEKSKGGIIIPDTAKEKPQEGRSSPWATARSPRTAPCARSTSRPATASCSANYSGTEIKIDGEEHLILREDDILGVLE